MNALINIPGANVVQSFVVNEEGTIHVVQRTMGSKDCIIGFHDNGGNVR